MSHLSIPIKLLRYLIVWKVNASTVILPPLFSAELSFVLSNLLSRRLPGNQARRWKKILSHYSLSDTLEKMRNKPKKVKLPYSFWPIEAVFFPYTIKRTFGFQEHITWELKLFGQAADHEFFLSYLLPAMEEAGYSADQEIKTKFSIWGNFEIQTVKVADGQTWKPVVKEGEVDLRYQPSTAQWSRDWDSLIPKKKIFFRIKWLSPVYSEEILSKKGMRAKENPPKLENIIGALIWRVGHLTLRRGKTFEDILADIDPEDRLMLLEVLKQVSEVELNKTTDDAGWFSLPGGWSGEEFFNKIPKKAISYLELASILHIGSFTHYGCGTFLLR